jgi:hypothetical protein
MIVTAALQASGHMAMPSPQPTTPSVVSTRTSVVTPVGEIVRIVITDDDGPHRADLHLILTSSDASTTLWNVGD